MSGDNVKIHSTTGLRYCAACRRETDRRVPTPLTQVEKEKMRTLFTKGATVNQLIHGTPVGGGKRNRALIVALPKDFYHARATDPEFDKFVSAHIANSGSIGQRARWRRVKTLAHTSSARSETDDYYSIRALIPASIPDRDDIVSRIFEDLLSGVLRRENVRSHIKKYVTEQNRLFPTNFAKFGDARLVSLDEVMFDGGTSTRGDYVSRGLWD
jgi:hypothetical protein